MIDPSPPTPLHYVERGGAGHKVSLFDVYYKSEKQIL